MKPVAPKVDSYDQRSSIYVDMGVNHGKGKTSPMGTLGNPKSESLLPKGCKHLKDSKEGNKEKTNGRY